MARQHISRLVTFGPALALPAWAWSAWREPGSFTGLAVMLVLGLAVLPALIVLAIFLVPKSGAALVSRERRKRYRRKLINRGIPREQQRSSRISGFLRRVTYAADRYRCTGCRQKLGVHFLQVDHYCPWSQGGLTTVWNTMSLCAGCNRVKSNYWHGVFYRPLDAESDDIRRAAAILARERRHRYNLLRLTRAAWTLGA